VPLVRSFEITNLDETIAALGGISTDAAQSLREGLHEAAAPIVAEAKRIAPHQEGTLADAVKVSGVSGIDSGVYIFGDGGVAPYLLNFHESALRGRGASTYYWFELRTQHGPSYALRRLPNLPFMLMAFDRKIDEAATIAIDAIDGALAKFEGG